MRANCEELQKNHARLRDIAVKWQIKFSIHKCELLHKGKSDQRRGSLLQRQDRWFHENVSSVLDVQKANQMLALTTKEQRTKQKPSQSHCLSLWFTCTLGIVCTSDLLSSKICIRTGKGSEKATRMIKGMKWLQCKEWLKVGCVSTQKENFEVAMEEICKTVIWIRNTCFKGLFQCQNNWCYSDLCSKQRKRGNALHSG